MAAEAFCNELTTISVAQLAQQAGFQSINSAACEALVDLARRYIGQLGTQAAECANHFGRSQTSLDDVALAMDSMGASVTAMERHLFTAHLQPFARANPPPFPAEVPPASVRAMSGPRPEYVYSHMPPFPEPPPPPAPAPTAAATASTAAKPLALVLMTLPILDRAKFQPPPVIVNMAQLANPAASNPPSPRPATPPVEPPAPVAPAEPMSAVPSPAPLAPPAPAPARKTPKISNVNRIRETPSRPPSSAAATPIGAATPTDASFAVPSPVPPTPAPAAPKPAKVKIPRNPVATPATPATPVAAPVPMSTEASPAPVEPASAAAAPVDPVPRHTPPPASVPPTPAPPTPAVAPTPAVISIAAPAVAATPGPAPVIKLKISVLPPRPGSAPSTPQAGSSTSLVVPITTPPAAAPPAKSATKKSSAQKAKPEPAVVPAAPPPAAPQEAGEGGEVYCICRTSRNDPDMVQCHLCETWYHFDCLKLSPGAPELAVEYYVCFRCNYPLSKELGTAIASAIKALKNSNPVLHNAFLKVITDDVIPGYSAIIKHPMALSTVCMKCQLGKYKVMQEVLKDLGLIVANCRVFNAGDPLYLSYADELSSFFENHIFPMLKH
eukprot:m.14201 g.14201  ORF g.14201 m.14201 type:complete len:611 (-) comp2913_c0_seq1:326-2158(-)